MGNERDARIGCGAVLRTARLRIHAADAELAALDARYDHVGLGQRLGAAVPDAWPPELTHDVLDFFAHTLEQHPENVGWWAWYLVRDDGEFEDPLLIGGAGFKGPPTDDGVVEVGYSILPAYQGRGYATEAVRALIAWSLAVPRTLAVVAETFPEHVASRRVLEKVGMREAGAGEEPGAIRFQLSRGDVESADAR